MQRDDYIVSTTKLTLVALYIAFNLALFANGHAGWLPLATGLPIKQGVLWICSDQPPAGEIDKAARAVTERLHPQLPAQQPVPPP